MKTIGAFEAKTHLSALLDEVENGEEVLITKRGRAVARLVPIIAVPVTRRALGLWQSRIPLPSHEDWALGDAETAAEFRSSLERPV